MTDRKFRPSRTIPDPGYFASGGQDDAEEIDGLAEGHLRILEAVFHEAAMIASEDPSPPRPDEIEDLAAIAEYVRRLTSRP